MTLAHFLIMYAWYMLHLFEIIRIAIIPLILVYPGHNHGLLYPQPITTSLQLCHWWKWYTVERTRKFAWPCLTAVLSSASQHAQMTWLAPGCRISCVVCQVSGVMCQLGTLRSGVSWVPGCWLPGYWVPGYWVPGYWVSIEYLDVGSQICECITQKQYHLHEIINWIKSYFS